MLCDSNHLTLFLYIAVLENNQRMMRSLLQQGLSINTVEDVEMLVGFYAKAESFEKLESKFRCYDLYWLREPISWKMTPLHLAVAKGRSTMVRFLVENGADLEIQMHCGFTALMLAQLFRHYDIVEYLLDAGANVNQKNWWNKTALSYAVQMREFELVKMYLQKGAKVNSVDFDDATPLLMSAKYGYADITLELLKYVDFKDITKNDKMDLLHYAGMHRQVNVFLTMLRMDKSTDHWSMIVNDDGSFNNYTTFWFSNELKNDILRILKSEKKNERSCGNWVTVR